MHQTHEDFEAMISASADSAVVHTPRTGAGLIRQVAIHQMGFIGMTREDVSYVD